MTLSSILLVDKRIHDHETIVAAIKADGVQAIVFDVSDIDAQASASFQYMLNKIADLGATSFSNIGIVQHNTGAPFHRFFAESQGEESTVAGVETADPTLQTWAGFAAFITTLKTTYGVQNVDLMACALYSNPDWKYVIDTLAVQTGVTVRASTDDTGAAALGGDWFLESHTGVNLKDVYFTEAIEDFRGVLIYSTKYNTSSLFSTKSMAVGKAVAWGSGGGTDVNTITGGVITSDVVALYSTGNAFAALKTNGSVSTWGGTNSGGNQTVGGTSPSVASSLTSGVVEIYANGYAFAALKNTGTVITWGNSDFGGTSSSVVLTNVVDVFSNSAAFAALKSNGSLVTWPSPSNYGGDSSTATSGLTSGVVSVNMAYTAGAALKSDGRVITWPTTGTTGGNSSTVTSSISSGVVAVHTDFINTFAALKNDGSVITWGTSSGTLASSVTLTNIVTIHSHTNGAYAALNTNGGVVTWGVNLNGGNSSGKSLSSNVVKVYNNAWAFAALKFDGSVVTWGGYTSSAWGGDSTSVASDLSSGVVAIYGNGYAFAALKSDGKVITWGHTTYGGTSSSVATDISAGIVAIYATGEAFAALRNDGKLITWGGSTAGGNSSSVSTDLSAGVVSVNNNYYAFAAITSTATTFDLSMSYYRDIDRYNILRNKENRRRVNLTTLNNNVFTLSSARDIQKFNYTIPSGNSFRIIVPDYVSSNYSIISTATLPSPAAANYIIACDEGEPVTISGVTYINYGAFVYRRNVADNTFTKMTSAVIDGVTYKLYGGDGLFSSGIALQYRFGAFTVPAKAFGDASFNITAPVTDSSGAFTYTSSNTTVATVTTGGTVTIIKAGSTTITATQAANGRFTSDSITASLVVSKIDSTLGALTVPTKLTSEAPFALTAPTSTNSSIVSPVYTITSAASMIVPPPAVHINPLTYGGGWFQEGGAFIGYAAGNNCGYSVSMSADGTIVAIGYIYASSDGISPRGLVRVFKSDITKTVANGLGPIGWNQLGGDIYGEAASDNAGWNVRISADGTVVAIAAHQNDGTDGTVNTGDDRGHVRVYKYTPTKTIARLSQTDPAFGPVGWTRMGADIDGHRAIDYSGEGLSISADGNIIGIGAKSNDGPSGTAAAMGHVRIYRYTPNKAAVTNVNDASFGPAGWTRIGSDIYGDAAGEYEGYSVALSADGTTFVTGSIYGAGGKGRIRTYVWNGTQWNKRGSDINGIAGSDLFGFSVAISADGNIIAGSARQADGSGNTILDSGVVRVYYWNTNTNNWTQQGGNIDGEAQSDDSGWSISLSSDGTIIAIGAYRNDGTSGTVNTSDDRGHVRIYKYDVNKTQAQLNQGVANFGPVGWIRLSNQSGYMSDLDGGAANNQFGYSVSLSSDGTKVLIGEPGYDEGGITNRGRATVRYIATTNALTYSSSSSSIADVCGNLLLIKGVNGTSTITASQTGNTVTGRLDVSGTTYTLQYNPIAFTSGSTNVATVSTYGTVTLAGAEGTSTITATQPETLNYSTRSVTATLAVSKIDSTLGALTVPAKIVSDAPFALTAPTSTVSSNISPTHTITSTSSVIVPPPDIRDLTYGTTWMKRGGDIDGEAEGNISGLSVAFSADGTTVAIGAPNATPPAGTLRVGHVRVYKYNPNKLTEVTDQTSASFGPVGWDRLGRDIDGEATEDQSGWSVALSADGTTVAIGAHSAGTTFDIGHVRVYKYNPNKVTEVTDQTLSNFGPVGWDRLGKDIDGVGTSLNSGYSVALSSDGTMVAIGTRYGTNYKGHVRVYNYNPNKLTEVTDQTSTSFGPVGWSRLGRDIDGEALNDFSGWSVALSADGTTVAIGAPNANNPAGTNDTGHVRVYKYNPNKVAEVTDQSSNSFGPIGWDRLGRDIDGEALNDQSGFSVALSSDGTTVAIGARYADKPGGTDNTRHVRVYKYNTNKLTEVTDQTSNSFGPVGWDRLGMDIDGEDAGDQNVGTGIEISVALSSDGTIVAIGAHTAKNHEGIPVGHVRVYKYNPNKLTEVTNQTLSNFGPVGWDRLGMDIDGEAQNDESGWSVALSADGTTVAIGARSANNPTGTDNVGHVRVYNIPINNALTYSSNNSSIADVCGNLLLIKGVNGTSTITASQTGNTVTGRLDVSGTTYTLQYNPITYTIDSSSVATVSTYGTVTLAGTVGTSTITATQPETLSYSSRSVTGSLVVSLPAPTIGALTAPAKNFGDASFNLTAPTSNSDGAFTYTSGNTAVATVTTEGTVAVVGAGSTTITATQAATTNYLGGSVTASIVVSPIAPTIGALTAPAKNFGDASFNLTAPTSNSGGAFTYTSSAPGVATVTTEGTVTVVGAGSTTITATQAASADGNYTGGSSVTASLVVSAIAPTIGALTAPAKNFGDASFNLTAPSSNSDGAFTYTSSAPGVATVTSGGTVTVIGAGSTTITATQAASGNYTGGSVTASLIVSAIAPTIGALSAPAKNFGDASFNLTAPTSNSGGAFSYTSSNTAVATVTSGGTVTVVGAGSTTITATQAATTNYTGGSSVTASLVVSAIAPTIGALSAPAKNFGDASFNLTAPSSNSDGAFTYTSSAPGVATVTSGGTVTVVGAGSTTITATQAASADGNYTGGSSVTASLVVSSITPTYSSISQITKTYSTDVSFSLTSIMSGVSNSSGAYTFSTTSAAIDICGGVATILAYTPSAITITATQAASGNYNGAGSTTFTLLVNRKVPSYGAFSVPAATYEDAPFSIAAYAPTTESTGVPFTYTSSEPTVATINSDGTVITIIGQGYTTITASQAAGGNYAASSTTTSFLVNRAAPTFLKAFTIPNKTFGDASFSLLPFTEGLDNTDGTYHFTSSNAQLVSISEVDGVTATILAYTPTPITIYVAIDACGNYAASSTSGTLTVARAAPTIGALTAPAKNFGDASFNLTAPTSNSDGAITYTSSAPGVATVTSTGGTVTVVGAGSTTITGTQAASGNYTVGSVTASLVVSAIAPTIGALTAPAKNFGDASFNLTAPTSNSGGAFTYTSSAPGVATVTSTGGTVTIVGTGTTTITATQAASADGNYTGGSSVTASLVVSASLSNFTAPTGKVYGDASFNLTDPTTIDNTVGFTFTSSNTVVATISGRTVTIVGAGSSVITASQAATENRAQMDISATLIVARLTPVITLADITKTYGSAQFRLTPTSTNTDDASGAALSFTSSNTDVASIVDTSFVSINGVGDATITIAIAATANFTDGSRNVVVTVNKGTPVLSTFSVSANKTYGSAPFSILTAPTSASAGAITYSSSDTDVATIDNSGVITLIAAGYVNFTATQAATSLYISATKTSNTMTVHRQSIFLTRDSPSVEIVNKTYGDEYFIVSATNAASGGALTYESDTPSVASVINSNTGVISVVSVGTATITATRAQTAQYTSDPVSWTIQVARATTTLTGLSNLTRNVTVAPFTVTATSASNGAVTYALQDPSSSILTIHPTSGLVRLLSPGSAVIVASQAQGTLYEAPNSITATITVSSAGNALEGLTLTTTTNYSDVNLNDAIINNANISGSNFAGAKLTGATFTGASIIGATFTNATLVRANLAGISISRTDFTNADLSGAILTGVDASGTIFNNASLANVNLTGANVANVNFTNTVIKGANITDVSFTPLQKLQLLKKSDNRDIAAIAISSVSGPTILAAISQSSPARTIANLDLSNIATTVAVYIPETSTTPDGPITDISLDVVNNTLFYIPINENEYFRINGVIYYSSSNVVRKYATNEIIEVITYNDKPVWLIVGSIIGLVLQTNTMNTSSFVVPTSKLSADTMPFMPTTLPTSNSDAPIVYSSSSPHLATINATTGEITITGNGNGLVTFTATQVQNATYGPATITSNTLLIDQYLHFSLVGLNQAFNLTTLASLDTLNLIADATDATAVFYVRLSDMTDIFKYQSDSADVNDVNATDLKYYVFHRKWPAELKINPSHAMVNKAESTGMLGSTDIFTPDKALVKHDFVRYIALKLFNTIHGVDLFANETDLQENATYYGESIRHNIHEIMSGISTTSGDESMARDASGNKYLTNTASGNTNLCRELMRQIAAAVASRFYNNGADNTGMKTVPLREEDTITFKVTIQAAATQNVLTGVTEIPSRSYTIKLVLKSSVTSVTNANTVVSDSEMFPNSYPYSSSVTSIAPDSESAATVYNIYSPPAPIPFSRFGFNGWYYTNSSAWVGVNSGVRNHVKWLVPANRVGSSTVGALQFVRVNLKIHNKTAVPYLMVYTQGGSWRKYIVSGGGGNSLVNGTIYSFYMNFNSYAREPAMIGYTNAALVNSVGSGTFTDNEVITGIAVETDSGAAAGAVEFTLASIIVGEIASGVPSEKEYGFLAEVPSAYP